MFSLQHISSRGKNRESRVFVDSINPRLRVQTVTEDGTLFRASRLRKQRQSRRSHHGAIPTLER